MGRMRCGWLLIGGLFLIGLEAPAGTDVWLDVDTSTGVGDVDDGLMMIQCFHSPEMTIAGISVQFGNATLAKAMPIAEEICRSFGPAGLTPMAGAESAADLGKETDAVKGMIAALEKKPMVVLAVGPVTNIATVLMRRPDLATQITSLVMVAARRPGQKFVTSDRQLRPHPDANFEKDPKGMQVLLDSSARLVFAPWEVTSFVWASREDLESLRRRGGSGEWIARTSQYWLNAWLIGIDDRGFNPFDTLAAGWVTHPELFESMPVRVRIVEDLDDRATAKEKEAGKKKLYLVTGPTEGEGRDALYLTKPSDQFHEILIERLGPTADRAIERGLR